MDATDFRLLVALFDDARQGYRSLGRRVSLSHPAVVDRLKKLERRGILRGFFLTVNPQAFGRQDLLVRFDGEWSRGDAEKALDSPDVVWVAWKLNGNLTVQLWPFDNNEGINGIAKTIGADPAGHFLAEPDRLSHPLSTVDWEIVDAMVDEPLVPLGNLIRATGLSPKTVRNHLRELLAKRTVHISPIVGSLGESGELIYTVSVFGQVGLPEIRAVLGDAYLIKQFQYPPAKHLLCRGSDLGEVLGKTRVLEKLPGAARVFVSLNREQLISRRFVHSVVQDQIEKLNHAWEFIGPPPGISPRQIL